MAGTTHKTYPRLVLRKVEGEKLPWQLFKVYRNGHAVRLTSSLEFESACRHVALTLEPGPIAKRLVRTLRKQQAKER